jgi:hypothetical protein
MGEEEQQVSKWYNSEFATAIGYGVGIAALCVGLGFGMIACQDIQNSHIMTRHEIRMEKRAAKAGFELQTADLNGNGIEDRFYNVGGDFALVEVDGMPASELIYKLNQ